jgi:hypothetical protein
MNARTSFLVWWGLPILGAGLGALIATYAGAGFGSDRVGRLTPLLAIVLYFAAAGCVAVIVRMRQSQVALGEGARFDRPVEAALVAMCAPILIAGLWVFLAGLIADFGSTRSVSGRLEGVEQVGSFRRSYFLDLDTTTQPLILECYGRRNCGQSQPLLRLPTDATVKADILGDRVLGLTVADKPVLHAGAQRFLRLLIDGALLVLMILYTAAFSMVAFNLLWPEEDEEVEGENGGEAMWSGR